MSGQVAFIIQAFQLDFTALLNVGEVNIILSAAVTSSSSSSSSFSSGSSSNSGLVSASFAADAVLF